MRKPTLISSNSAFTLLEVLIALVILMVGMLGLLEAINVSIVSNVRNDMRTQAAAIAEGQLAQKKSLPFKNITTTVDEPHTFTMPVKVRSAQLNYSITYYVDSIPAGALDPNAKRINIGVRWSYKGNNYEHVVSSIVTRPGT